MSHLLSAWPCVAIPPAHSSLPLPLLFFLQHYCVFSIVQAIFCTSTVVTPNGSYRAATITRRHCCCCTCGCVYCPCAWPGIPWQLTLCAESFNHTYSQCSARVRGAALDPDGGPRPLHVVCSDSFKRLPLSRHRQACLGTRSKCLPGSTAAAVKQRAEWDANV